jgi:glycosyltransferase involved in cell wall biosynthesis
MSTGRSLWILNHYAATPDVPGFSRHFDFGSELVKHGWSVCVFASAFCHKQRRLVKLSGSEQYRVETIDGVTFVWIRTTPYVGNDLRRAWGMVSYMLRAQHLGRRLPYLDPHIPPPDVVLGSSSHLLAVVAARHLARRYDARFLMEVRDLWPQVAFDLGKISPNGIPGRVLQRLELWLYKEAERIITPLPYAGEYISSKGIDAGKVVVIPNGVPLRSPPTCDLPMKTDDTFLITYLGAHGEANALHVVLEAARVLQDAGMTRIQLVLIGDGPEKPKLIELAQQWRLQNVVFRDPVPKSQVPAALSSSDALVLNLRRMDVLKYGVSPNKLFDYMAAGRPTIFSADSPNNPVAEAQCGESVPAEDPQALADAMVRLSRQPIASLAVMGRNAREYVERHHSIPVLAEKMLSVLESTHGSRPARDKE